MSIPSIASKACAIARNLPETRRETEDDVRVVIGERVVFLHCRERRVEPVVLEADGVQQSARGFEDARREICRGGARG
jgi:very-short-patch-repair endonuclease